MNYKCKNLDCNFTDDRIDKMIEHTFAIHAHSYGKLSCFHFDCKKQFKQFVSFRSHVIKKHQLKETDSYHLKCTFSNCSQIMSSIESLYSHTYEHLKKNEQTVCFYKDCNYKATKYSSFKTHLSERHKIKQIEFLKDELVLPDHDDSFVDDYDDDQDARFENQTTQSAQSVDLNLSYKLMKNLADLTKLYMMIYLKLKDKYLVAEYKCDEIFEDFNQLIRINNNNINDLIAHTNNLYNNNHEQTLKTIQTHLDNTLFEEVHAKMRLDSSKSKWLAETNVFVEPKEITIDDENKFMYIPILSTIKSLFQNHEIASRYFESNKQKSKNMSSIKCFNDSKYFKENELFQNNINYLQLIVYNDGFDSNNPLGDYRNSDKVNGTYFKIGNFDECYLSLSYFVQLAILADVKSVKKFGYETIFKPLLDDLQLLENEGIIINFENVTYNLKGTISFFPADNLASNGVGGFVESFNCGLSNLNI